MRAAKRWRSCWPRPSAASASVAGHHHRKANADEHRDRRIEEGLDVGAVGVLQAQQRGQVHRQRQCEQRALRVMQHQPQWQEHRRQHQRQQAEVMYGREHAEQVHAGHHRSDHRPHQERHHARRRIILRGEERGGHRGHHCAVAAAFPAHAMP
ncbi:hypothetical protein G6F68_014966 [Rhizopus microsporus]|nr:hypothetical protein G6F68_014966 [Rhizopus microsporus]